MDFFKFDDGAERDKELTELLARKQHEEKYVGSQQKVAGHTMFSFNTLTKEIKVAKVTRCMTYDWMKQGKAFSDKVHKERNCIYIQALNKKNAIKHLKRLGYNV